MQVLVRPEDALIDPVVGDAVWLVDLVHRAAIWWPTMINQRMWLLKLRLVSNTL